MLALLLAATAWAQNPVKPLGTGASDDPYQIATLDNLAWISQDSTTWKAYFLQTADIDATPTKTWDNGDGFSPIGGTVPFTGDYNGNGKTITGLFIDRDSVHNIALFGRVSGAQTCIYNLSVTDADIKGGNTVGILLGYCDSASITYCHVSGTVTAQRWGGGLGGYTRAVKIFYCSSNASVTTSASRTFSGGLVGYHSGTISNSFSIGTVDATGDSTSIGGLIGAFYTYSTNSLINCYSAAKILSSGFDSKLGGLVGGNLIGSIATSYYDMESGCSSSATGIGLTTAQMQTKESYAGWDFEHIWEITPGNYPQLRNISQLQPVGKGTTSNPYRISSLDNLFWLSQHEEIWNSHFIQTADIDAAPTAQWNAGSGWKPIGTWTNPFSGTYNGNGHAISNLAFNRDSSLTFLGLFGHAKGPGCSISWVRLTGIDFTMRTKSSGSYTNLTQTSIGGIAGKLAGHARIDGCSVEGALSAPIGRVSIGGLVGTMDSSSVMTSYSNCTITAVSPSNLGGLIGHWVESTMMNSYSSSRFVVDIMDKYWFGGLVGYGYHRFNHPIQSCYWDIETSGIDTSKIGGSGKSTAEMKTESTYSGWDFTNTWSMSADGYPQLRKPIAQALTRPSGSGTESDPYLIQTLTNLVWLSKSPDQWDKYFKQTAQIDASESGGWESGYGWSPIGTDSIPFTGSYDGGGHAIVGLTISRPGLSSCGFFGRVSGESYLKNINLTNAKVKGFRYIGTLAGRAESSTIISCTSTSTYCSSDNALSSSMVWIGGLVGYSSTNNYKNCFFSGTVTADTAGDLVGGMIGRSSNDSVIDCKVIPSITMSDFDGSVGGLIGEMNWGFVSRCTTECAIDINEDWINIGGLVGDAGGFPTISSCMTSGTIVSNGAGNYAGGIAGDNNADIYGCQSSCAITGKGESITIGGLVARNFAGLVYACAATGPLTGNALNNYIAGLVYSYNPGANDIISNSYSLCSISVNLPGTVPNTMSVVYGLVGSDVEEISKCYRAGPITISGLPIRLQGEFGSACFWDSISAGANVYKQGFSTAQMKQMSTYADSGWDFTNIWGMNPEVNDGYPFLRWQRPDVITMTQQKPLPLSTPVLLHQRRNSVCYSLSSDVTIAAKIFNLKGACVASLTERRMAPGRYTLNELTDKLGMGKYMLVFKAGPIRTVKDFTIIR